MKFIFKNDNDGDACTITMSPGIVTIQGKFLPRKGRIDKIETLIQSIGQKHFEKKLVIDIEDFVLADSTGIIKMKKIIKAITKNTKEVSLIIQGGNRFHEITMKTAIESIPNIKRVTLC